MLRNPSNSGKTALVTQRRNLSLRPDRDEVESSSGEWEVVCRVKSVQRGRAGGGDANVALVTPVSGVFEPALITEAGWRLEVPCMGTSL